MATVQALMDDVKTHAAAAALACDSKFLDVAVGHPTPRGRCVRVFYNGEREPEEMGAGRTLNSRMVAEAVMVRGFWPVSEYAAKRGRLLMSEVWTFIYQLRSRLAGDSQLGGDSADLNIHLAMVDDVLIAGTLYVIADVEVVADYHEYAIAP